MTDELERAEANLRVVEREFGSMKLKLEEAQAWRERAGAKIQRDWPKRLDAIRAVLCASGRARACSRATASTSSAGGVTRQHE